MTTLSLCGPSDQVKSRPRKPRAHGAKIAWRDDVDERAAVDAFGTLDALREGQSPGAILAEGKVVGDAGAFDAGDCADAGEDLLEDGGAFLCGERRRFCRLGTLSS